MVNSLGICFVYYVCTCYLYFLKLIRLVVLNMKIMIEVVFFKKGEEELGVLGSLFWKGEFSGSVRRLD